MFEILWELPKCDTEIGCEQTTVGKNGADELGADTGLPRTFVKKKKKKGRKKRKSNTRKVQ